MIPKKFWKYFWDVDAAKLDVSKNSMFIIQRLLDWNDFGAAKWVIKTYPKAVIIECLEKLRGWSRRSANFWANFFGLPRSQVLCLNRGLPHQPVSHWSL